MERGVCRNDRSFEAWLYGGGCKMRAAMSVLDSWLPNCAFFLLSLLIFQQPLRSWVRALVRRLYRQPAGLTPQELAARPVTEDGDLFTLEVARKNLRNTARLIPPTGDWRNAAGVSFVTTGTAEGLTDGSMESGAWD